MNDPIPVALEGGSQPALGLRVRPLGGIRARRKRREVPLFLRLDALRKRVRRPDYRLVPETERIGAAYSAADLVLSRAGSSVWELAAAGRPAILVPYPFATADHQAKNAEHFVRAGGAIMVRDLDLEDVPDLVRSLLDDPPRLERMGAAMLRAARPAAAAEIAEELIDLAGA